MCINIMWSGLRLLLQRLLTRSLCIFASSLASSLAIISSSDVMPAR